MKTDLNRTLSVELAFKINASRGTIRCHQASGDLSITACTHKARSEEVANHELSQLTGETRSLG